MVYKLYDLTPEEIAIVEGKVMKTRNIAGKIECGINELLESSDLNCIDSAIFARMINTVKGVDSNGIRHY
ncbi:MAG: hypothetical protein A2099_03290 [Planctomycetes bacterium GWF2_39_10]|nr:MAG: hypothetical protein A2099_03290 [Planctomycetes bacterium GWF2_39_10]